MCQPYPSDPADLFLRLYRELDDEAARDGRAARWDEDEQVHEIAELVEETAVREGSFAPETVREQIEIALDEEARRYAYLLGLDRALALAHPATDAVDRGRITAIASRYRTRGRLNTDADDGALLPRFAWPSRLQVMADPPTDQLADLFLQVTVVSPETWAHVRSTRVPRRFDLPATVRTEGLVVGCAPVSGLADVRISASEDQRRRYYHVEPLDSDTTRDRIVLIVRRLDEQGVEVAVMPELTLSQTLLEHWKAVLAAPAPRGSRLRLLMVGSGPLERFGRRVANRAVLLTRSGEVLVTQDKRHGFTLTPQQVSDWGLTDLLESDDAHAEPLQLGQTLSVLETSLGRISILICEDLELGS